MASLAQTTQISGGRMDFALDASDVAGDYTLLFLG
jgi:hypothetical protein